MQISDWLSSVLALVVIVLAFVTIRLTTKSMNHEKQMRNLELNVSLFEKRIDFIIKLTDIVYSIDGAQLDFNWLLSTKDIIKFLFPSEISSDIQSLVKNLYEFHKDGKQISVYLDKYSDNKLLDKLNGRERIIFAFSIELEEITKKCKPFMDISSVKKDKNNNTSNTEVSKSGNTSSKKEKKKAE